MDIITTTIIDTNDTLETVITIINSKGESKFPPPVVTVSMGFKG